MTVAQLKIIPWHAYHDWQPTCQVCPEGMLRLRAVDKGHQSLDHLGARERPSKLILPSLVDACLQLVVANYLVSLGGGLPVLGGHNRQANLNRSL